MAKHLHIKPLACVLLTTAFTLPAAIPHALSDENNVCSQVFSQIKKNEPVLAQEMDDLKQLCLEDIAQSGTVYWQCVDGYLASRTYNSDNLILAGHLCVTAEQLSQTDNFK